jgi:epsin
MIEYLIKNGAPRCIGEFKDDISKISFFNDYSFFEGNTDRGASSKELKFRI